MSSADAYGKPGTIECVTCEGELVVLVISAWIAVSNFLNVTLTPNNVEVQTGCTLLNYADSMHASNETATGCWIFDSDDFARRTSEILTTYDANGNQTNKQKD